jgi:hypothetical protein
MPTVGSGIISSALTGCAECSPEAAVIIPAIAIGG